MCNCMQELEIKALVKFKQDYPNNSVERINPINQGISFTSGRLIYFQEILLDYKKGKLTRHTSYKFFHLYCPICGEKINYDQEEKNG